MRRLDPRECAVVVVDVQDKLAKAMPEPRLADLVRAATVLLEAARLFGAASLATEQYPAGLGRTVTPIAEALQQAGALTIEKLDFSACDEPAFARALASVAPRAVVVVGMEAHVCVYQTVRELCARGIEVHVPIDGVVSRRDDHRAVGIDLCRDAGATITTMETLVFDWLRRAGSAEFKMLSKRIR